MQVSRTTGSAALGAVLADVMASPGGPVAGLYRGIGAATLRLIPMACVSFGVYELMRAALVNLETWQVGGRWAIN